MRRTPPIRRGWLRARTRRYRTDRAGWCAEASSARAAGFGIEPRRLRQRASERAPLGRGRRHAPEEEIAVVVDVAAHAAFGRQPGEVILRDRAEPAHLPGVDRDHEMAGEALHQRP